MSPGAFFLSAMYTFNHVSNQLFAHVHDKRLQTVKVVEWLDQRRGGMVASHGVLPPCI